MKKCKECNEIKSLASFHRNSRMKGGHLNICSKCRRYRCEPINPIKKRAAQLKTLYGITIEQYNSLLLAQNKVCAICEKLESIKSRDGVIRPLAVDHDHDTGKVRGLLCSACNSGVGYFKESPGLLKTAAAYCFFGGYDGTRSQI